VASCSRISSLTVAGQWRIFTALPVHLTSALLFRLSVLVRAKHHQQKIPPPFHSTRKKSQRSSEPVLRAAPRADPERGVSLRSLAIHDAKSDTKPAGPSAKSIFGNRSGSSLALPSSTGSNRGEPGRSPGSRFVGLKPPSQRLSRASGNSLRSSTLTVAGAAPVFYRLPIQNQVLNFIRQPEQPSQVAVFVRGQAPGEYPAAEVCRPRAHRVRPPGCLCLEGMPFYARRARRNARRGAPRAVRSCLNAAAGKPRPRQEPFPREEISAERLTGRRGARRVRRHQITAATFSRLPPLEDQFRSKLDVAIVGRGGGDASERCGAES